MKIRSIITLVVAVLSFSALADSGEPKELGEWTASVTNAAGIVYRIGPKADLSNADLSGLNLANADLNHSNLTGANFSNANLSNANLSYCRRRGADFSNANLLNADLRHGFSESVNFSGAILVGVNFDGSNLSGANFAGADVAGTYLEFQSKAELEGKNPGEERLQNELVSLCEPYPKLNGESRTDQISVVHAASVLAHQAGLKYDWKKSYANTKPYGGRWTYPKIENKPFDRAMFMLLEPFELSYQIEEGTVVLVTQ